MKRTRMIESGSKIGKDRECSGLNRGMPGQRSGSGWVGEQGEGGWVRRFSEGKPGKGITFEM